jgi:hypothetical protein
MRPILPLLALLTACSTGGGKSTSDTAPPETDAPETDVITPDDTDVSQPPTDDTDPESAPQETDPRDTDGTPDTGDPVPDGAVVETDTGDGTGLAPHDTQGDPPDEADPPDPTEDTSEGSGVPPIDSDPPDASPTAPPPVELDCSNIWDSGGNLLECCQMWRDECIAAGDTDCDWICNG